jgi:hypothetical protein
VHMAAWGVVFILEFNSGWMRCKVEIFFQQKLVVIVLEFQLHDWGWKVSKELVLKINNKIHNVQQNVGFVLVLMNNHINKDDLKFSK